MEQAQKRKKLAKRKVLRHRLSVVLITVVIVMLTGVLFVDSVKLLKKRKQQDIQIVELEKEKEEQEIIKEELIEKDEYYKSDKYIEDVARNQGMAYENEILFRPEE